MFAYTERFELLFERVTAFIQKARIHIIVWTVFIAYEISIVRLITGHFASFGDYAIHYSLNILFFYFHAQYALPTALEGSRKHDIWKPLLVFIAEVFGYLLISFAFEFIATKITPVQIANPITLRYTTMIGAIWRVIYIGGFSTGYYLLMNNIKDRKTREQLEQQRLQDIIKTQSIEKELANAQSAYLKAQINPHFLFNTLNFIHNKTRKTSPVAAEAIIILAAMMRFAASIEMQDEYLKLETEIEQVENLIRLHQIREGESLKIDLIVPEDMREIKIIPFVIITLAENMFKHGNLRAESFIKISFDKQHVTIDTENLVNNKSNNSGLNSGLDNIKKRLALAYGDKYVFNAKISGDKFKTLVTVPFH